MRLLVLATLAAVALAAPQYGYPQPQPDSVESDEVVAAATPARSYNAPRPRDDSIEFIPILRDNRDRDDSGAYSVDVETGNGITLEQSGDSYGNKQGSISFTHPDGTPFYMTYVADENGFQPQSDALPVAPAFPHPIPDFVLRQIEFARQEDEAAARAAASAPSGRYAAPASSEEVSIPRNNYAAPRGKRDLANAYAAPQNRYAAPRSFDSAESAEVIPILRNDLVQEDDGAYSLDVETANGISISESGNSDGNKQGVISFTHPDGTPFYMTFVADENGFQPQSDALPVAPAFPHPIPDFVLRQIEFARQEDEARARAAASAPSGRYAAPASSEETYSPPSSRYSAPSSSEEYN